MPPASSSRRSPPPRRRRWLLAAVLTIVPLAAGTLGGLWWWHFARTPPFPEHLRTQPVAPERFDVRLAAGTELAATGEWATGSKDPFTFVGEDPKHVYDLLRCEIDLKRGSDVLLHIVRELGLVEERETGARLGIAVRTPEFTVGKDLRAIARIYLHDVEHLLEDGAGAVTFDVLVGAGDGRAEAAVVAVPAAELWALPAEDPCPHGMIQMLLPRLWPRPEGQPIEGVLHHFRWSSPLAWRHLPDGSQEAVPPPRELLHEASTYEYSYEITARCIVRGARNQVTQPFPSRNRQLSSSFGYW